MATNPSKKKAARQAKPKYVTWEEFEDRYLIREDGFKYEWIDGTIEKTPSTMNQTQLFIWHLLNQLLWSLRSEDESIGSFSTETDTFLAEKIHRKPDIAYFTLDQMKLAAEGEPQIPLFVIEIISKNDNVNRVNRKIGEYFGAGVKVLWHIFPELKEVHIYEDAHGSSIRRGDETCSAEKVIPGFVLSVNDIFKLP